MKNKNSFVTTDTYIVDDALSEAVNVAISLEKPLLIKGEPGTGKTVLAKEIAKSLGLDLITWNIKSTTKASEGLYIYDTVARLYDSQFKEGDVKDIDKYIKLGKLGEAFNNKNRCVLLIDEIDKADIEFHNDLLSELDLMEFSIPETKKVIKAKHRPIVIITSNAEKELPDAFLRRLIFYYIDFPDINLMEKIVKVHFPKIEEKLLKNALEAFYRIREIRDINKYPATSELLDFIKALTLAGIKPEKIKKEIPFLGTLLKKNQDIDTYKINS